MFCDFERKFKMRVFKSMRTRILIAMDLAVFSGVYGLITTLNAVVSGAHNDSFGIGMNFLVCIVLFFAFRMILGIYSSVWRYANTVAYFKMVLSDAASGVIATLIT